MLKSLIGFNWRKSDAHLLLLSMFLHAKAADDFAKADPRADGWNSVLRETPQTAIKRFVDEGLLVTPGLSEHLAYKYKVSELQAMLKQRALPVSGRKDDLISRLIEADPGGMKKAVAGLTVLQCSDRGQEIANQYLAAKKAEQEAAEREVLAMLQKGKYREASLAVSSYEARQVFPRGWAFGTDWRKHDPTRDVATLKQIFSSKPKPLAQLDQSKLGALRIAAGMMALWGTSEAGAWLPSHFETGLTIDNDAAAQTLLFGSSHQSQLEQWRQSGVVAGVRVLTAKDSCNECRKLEGKKYRLSEAPELPNAKCTSPKGCRCTLTAILDVDWK